MVLKHQSPSRLGGPAFLAFLEHAPSFDFGSSSTSSLLWGSFDSQDPVGGLGVYFLYARRHAIVG